ncbi:MAG: rhombosortase [Pseudomonadota bacterium]
MNRRTNTESKVRLAVIVFGLALVAIAALGDTIANQLAYYRPQILSGEIWRLLTPHLVHLNLTHAVMNAAAIILLGMLVGSAASIRCWLVIYAVLAIGISLMFLALNEDLYRYVGASGVVHGLAAFGALRRMSIARVESSLLLAGLAIKLGYEQIAVSALSTEALIGGRVITDAHLYGAIIGLLLYGIDLGWRRRKASRQQS